MDVLYVECQDCMAVGVVVQALTALKTASESWSSSNRSWMLG